MVILPPNNPTNAKSAPRAGGVILPALSASDGGVSSGINDLMAYNGVLAQQAQEVEIWGVPVTVVIPKTRNMEGYELELNKNRDNYVYETSKAFINLQPKRSVFYKYNWVPEDADELTAITFHPSFVVFADMFVRTTVAGNPSPYGDLLFKIVKVIDDGKYQVLGRMAFAKPMTDQQVWKNLFPEERNI